jgi:hypothetical protein
VTHASTGRRSLRLLAHPRPTFEVLEADASTPFRTFTRTGDFYSPDCDHVPFPVPPGGALEGESGYQCTTDGDCHLLVVHRPTKRLYEMWRANIVGPSFGVRFRLRADFPMASLPSEGARVVARALQRYGMILADGGDIALTAQSDRFTTHKWSEVGVDTRALQAIRVTDMEVVGMGTPIPLTYDCVRNP